MSVGGGAALDMLPRAAQEDYAGVLREHDVGLALMHTPHPSLVPIEMASAGMLTVTNSFENKTAEAMAAISPNITAAEPGIEAIATALCDASEAARPRPPRGGQPGGLEPELGRVVRRRADGPRRGAARQVTPTGAPPPGLAPPPGNPRFALFDSLRGLAALTILAFHVCSITGALGNPVTGDVLTVAGPRSLVLFFVISGFLLYRPYVAARADGRSGPRLSRYLRRRVFRIVPAYWVALTVLAIYPGIVGVFDDTWHRYYFFTHLYSQDTVGGGIPVAWSLCVEVTFYLLLPLWAWTVARVRLGSGPRAWLRAELLPLGIVILGGIGVQVATAQREVSDLVGSSLLGQCVWLGLGMGLAVASVAAQRGQLNPRAVGFVTRRSGLLWIGAGLSLAGIALLLDPRGLTGIIQSLSAEQPIAETLAVIALTASLSTLLVLPAIFGEDAGGLPRRLLAARPVAWFGLVSYGLFLWHLTTAQWLALPADPLHFSASGLDLVDKLGGAATPVLLLLTLALSSVLAALSYYLVELPFLRRKG